MKTFFGRVLAVLVGIGLFIFLSFMFISFIATAFSFNNDDKINLKENSILTIQLDQPFVESLTETENSIFEFNPEEKPTLSQIILAIQKAKDDDNIKGISLEMDMASEDEISQLALIRNEIIDFKKSGKFVYAYTNRVPQGAYYLATTADSIFHNPLGTIELKGLASEVTFYKNLGEKYGIEFEIIRHGKYKSAVEPFIRDNLSDENKFQLTEIIDELWANMAKDMSQSRKISLQNFNQTTDSLGGFLATDALKNNLVDVISHENEYTDFLKKKLNIEEDDDFHTIDLTEYTSTIKKDFHEDKIAVLYAHGMITIGYKQYGIQSDFYKKEIRKLKENDRIKAVVLRINSGGGDANVSEELLHELKELHKKKPIVVSFGDVAASGGYYIAMASDKIFAEPYTITGSIGVLGMIPNAKGLLNNIGITEDHVQSNANSYYYSPFEGLTPHAKQVLTKSTEHVYELFVKRVAENRKMPFAAIDSLGGGRIYTGTQAKSLGLVDEMGSLQDAIAFAAEKAELDDFQIKSYPIKKSNFEALLKELDIAAVTKKELLKSMDSKALQTYLKIEQLRKLKGAQVLWPYDFKIN